MEKVKREADATGDWDTAFSGSFFSNRQMLDELVVILFISILLMYFILAAQFESFKDPLIIMLTVPSRHCRRTGVHVFRGGLR